MTEACASAEANRLRNLRRIKQRDDSTWRKDATELLEHYLGWKPQEESLQMRLHKTVAIRGMLSDGKAQRAEPPQQQHSPEIEGESLSEKDLRIFACYQRITKLEAHAEALAEALNQSNQMLIACSESAAILRRVDKTGGWQRAEQGIIDLVIANSKARADWRRHKNE